MTKYMDYDNNAFLLGLLCSHSLDAYFFKTEVAVLSIMQRLINHLDRIIITIASGLGK